MTTSGATLPIWVDDGLVTDGPAVVPATDLGLRSGLGVFETLRAHGTATLAADRHVTRLGEGAERLSIPFDRTRVERALHEILATPREVAEVVVRITLTAGPLDDDSAWPPTPAGRPTLVVTLHAAPSLPLPPAHAVTIEAVRWPADVKSTSYVASVLASRAARAAGADMAVLTDGDQLLETAEGNLFALIDGALVTPPDDGRLLAGITRQLLLEQAQSLGIATRVAPLHRDDITHASALAASSSVAGLRTIVSIDGAVPSCATAGDTEHPLFVALRDALAAGRA
jgi:branched-subunit amino acid aminotransferase/4-amino-4-deoxychorismate lyase